MFRKISINFVFLSDTECGSFQLGQFQRWASCYESSGGICERVVIGSQARLRIWCLVRMGSSPFARTKSPEVFAFGLFRICIHDTAQQVAQAAWGIGAFFLHEIHATFKSPLIINNLELAPWHRPAKVTWK